MTELTQLQQMVLVKIWSTRERVPLQLIKDIMRKGGKRQHQLVEIEQKQMFVNIIPPDTLEDLYKIRAVTRIKCESQEFDN